MNRPLPEIDPDSKPFWDGTAQSELRFQRCADCHSAIFYPRNICPFCHSQQLDWETSAGRGTVYSFTVARKPAGPAFADAVPMTIGLVDVEEGFRMMSNILGDPDRVAIGARVRVVFRPAGENVVLPLFELEQA